VIDSPPEKLRSDRVEAALAVALEGGSPEVFFDLVDRLSGMPGPRPHTDVLRAFGARIASQGKPGDALARQLVESSRLSLFYVGVMALAAQASKKGERRATERLVTLADEPLKERRDAVIAGLELLLAARGDEGAAAVGPLADGYLHAYVVLEALTAQRVLERLASSASVLDVLGAAYATADAAPRSADRSQGLRVLRQGIPTQIARASVRFADVVPWLRERLSWPRPDTREVAAATIRGLRKIVGEGEADRLRVELEGSAKAPRDPTRIVKGTRNRSRGR